MSDDSQTEVQPVERLAYTINEFAEAARLSRPTIYRMLKDGELRATRTRGHYRIPVSEAQRLFGEPDRVA
jgi:excisionase family DNA binding protein